jgi:hypothetical protein
VPVQALGADQAFLGFYVLVAVQELIAVQELVSVQAAHAQTVMPV